MSLVLVRCDALPEHTDYRDTGCEVSPSCLSCPLPKCRYDDGGRVPTQRVVAREAAAIPLLAAGLSVRQVANRLCVSTSAVKRVSVRYRRSLHGVCTLDS